MTLKSSPTTGVRHTREVVPRVVLEHSGVDQHEACDPVGVRCGPLQAPRTAEVVQHEVRPVDLQGGQGLVEEGGIAVKR